jgi:uncharacterized RDD family membrane protein YckC
MLPEELWRYRTFWRRFWAGWLDGLLLTLFGRAAYFLTGGSDLEGYSALGLTVSLRIVGILYVVGGHALFGQTLGKRACRVLVLDLDGQVPGWRRAALRDAFPILLAIAATIGEYQQLVVHGWSWHEAESASEYSLAGVAPAAWFVLELVTMLSNRRRRALHDYIAGTVVIRGRWTAETDEPEPEPEPEPD